MPNLAPAFFTPAFRRLKSLAYRMGTERELSHLMENARNFDQDYFSQRIGAFFSDLSVKLNQTTDPGPWEKCEELLVVIGETIKTVNPTLAKECSAIRSIRNRANKKKKLSDLLQNKEVVALFGSELYDLCTAGHLTRQEHMDATADESQKVFSHDTHAAAGQAAYSDLERKSVRRFIRIMCTLLEFFAPPALRASQERQETPEKEEEEVRIVPMRM